MQHPPINDQHRMAAFTAMRWPGLTYEAAMQSDTHRRVIECRAAHIRTREWESTQQRTVVPVKRIVLGADGHPVGWCTQMARGPQQAIQQPELPDFRS